MHINEFRLFLSSLTRKISLLLSLVFWIAIIFSFDETDLAVLTVSAIFLHELGHITYAWIISGKLCMPRPSTYGFKLRTERILTYKEETLLYISGPLANIFVFVALYPLAKNGHEYLLKFSVINLLTALSNLLPIDGYDGFGIIRAMTSALLPYRTAYIICNLVSFVCSFCICTVSLYIIDRTGGNFWFFGIFFSSFISKLSFLSKKEKQEQFGDL